LFLFSSPFAPPPASPVSRPVEMRVQGQDASISLTKAILLATLHIHLRVHR
jgi:hypothetical protein